MPQNGRSVTLLLSSDVAAVLASEAVEPVSTASENIRPLTFSYNTLTGLSPDLRGT